MELGDDHRADDLPRTSRRSSCWGATRELEREREAAGLYEEALEARRLRLEQEASIIYWRSRAETEAA